MKWNLIRGSRKVHRTGAIIIALPFLVVIVSGIFLQLKKDVNWIQPETRTGSPAELTITFDSLLSISRTVDEAQIESWQDIDRIDVRPDKGIAKIRSVNHWEIQIDTNTGEIIQVEYRRSDIIESIHDGSWFADPVKYWIFLPTAIIVLILWTSGMYLYFLPKLHKRRNKKWRENLKMEQQKKAYQEKLDRL